MQDIKFYCYYLDYSLSPSLMNFTLKEYFSNKLKLSDHLITINDNKAFLEKITNNIFSFQKFKKDSFPSIKDEKTGAVRNINLADSESFIEEVFLYWDFDNNIIFFQKNTSGFNASYFEKYMHALLKDKLENNKFDLHGILSKDGVEKLLKHKVVRTLEISVREPSIAILKELGFNSSEIRDIDQDSIKNIEIKITSKKKKSLFSMESLLKKLDFSSNKDKYNKLKLKACDSHMASSEIIDMLDQFYVVTEKIKSDSNNKLKHNRIVNSDIITTLERVYEEHIEEVLKLT